MSYTIHLQILFSINYEITELQTKEPLTSLLDTSRFYLRLSYLTVVSNETSKQIIFKE